MKGGGYTGRDGHQKVIWQGDLFHINRGICFFELQIICTCSLYFFLDISALEWYRVPSFPLGN